MTSWRMSGRAMGGRGSEMSSKAMVSFMPGTEQRRQRVAVAHRMEQGVADGRPRIRQGIDRLGRVDDPAALGQPLEAETLAVPEQGRRRRTVDVEHESGSRAHRASP